MGRVPASCLNENDGYTFNQTNLYQQQRLLIAPWETFATNTGKDMDQREIEIGGRGTSDWEKNGGWNVSVAAAREPTLSFVSQSKTEGNPSFG